MRPHSRERGLVQGKLCGCYVGLSLGRSNPGAHSLIHLLLQLLKPRGYRPHHERGRSDLITCLAINHEPLCEWLHCSQPRQGRERPLLGISAHIDRVQIPISLGDSHTCLFPSEDQCVSPSPSEVTVRQTRDATPIVESAPPVQWQCPPSRSRRPSPFPHVGAPLCTWFLSGWQRTAGSTNSTPDSLGKVEPVRLEEYGQPRHKCPVPQAQA